MKKLRAIHDRILVAPVQRRDHIPVQTSTGEEVKLWMGREKGEPLGVVLSVGPEVGGGGALKRAVDEFITEADEAGNREHDVGAMYYCGGRDALVTALSAQDVKAGDVVVYRRSESESMARTGGIQDWSPADGIKFDVECIGEQDVWGVLDEVEDEYVTSDGEARAPGAIVECVS